MTDTGPQMATFLEEKNKKIASLQAQLAKEHQAGFDDAKEFYQAEFDHLKAQLAEAWDSLDLLQSDNDKLRHALFCVSNNLNLLATTMKQANITPFPINLCKSLSQYCKEAISK